MDVSTRVSRRGGAFEGMAITTTRVSPGHVVSRSLSDSHWFTPRHPCTAAYDVSLYYPADCGSRCRLPGLGHRPINDSDLFRDVGRPRLPVRKRSAHSGPRSLCRASHGPMRCDEVSSIETDPAPLCVDERVRVGRAGLTSRPAVPSRAHGRDGLCCCPRRAGGRRRRTAVVSDTAVRR